MNGNGTKDCMVGRIVDNREEAAEERGSNLQPTQEGNWPTLSLPLSLSFTLFPYAHTHSPSQLLNLRACSWNPDLAHVTYDEQSHHFKKKKEKKVEADMEKRKG